MQTAALHPMRRATRGAALEALGWDEALDGVATRLAHIVGSHGPDAVGIYLSGQLSTEDLQIFNSLGRELIATTNIGSNLRLGLGSAITAHRASLGRDVHAASDDEIGRAQTVFIAGANIACTQPPLFEHIEQARRANADVKLIVVDPRRTATAARADLHLQLLPGTDVVLLHAMLHLMLWEGLVDHAFIREHSTGFEALRDRVREFTPAHAAKTCGLREADIVQAARWFGGVHGSDIERRTPTLSLAGLGLHQSTSGTDKNSALINLHLAAGQIDKPGAGPFVLPGQRNAMGAIGLGLYNAVDIFQAAADGAIKALWIAGANPAQSLPDQTTVRRAFERAEFVIVQDTCSTTATAALADLLLPATGRSDAHIASDVARRLERCLPRRGIGTSAGIAKNSAHGRARFIAPAWRPSADVRDARFPVSLTTGRLREHWLSTGHSTAPHHSAASEPVLELHPQELVRRRWSTGELVCVKARRGELVLPVRGNESVQPAQAFIAMHWGPEVMAGLGLNVLTGGAACAQSGVPEFKHTAVRIERAELPWATMAAAWLPKAQALAAQQQLRTHFARFPFASCVLFSDEQPVRLGVLFRAALAEPAPAALIDDIEAALQMGQLGGNAVQRYGDARSGQRRALCLHTDGSAQAVLLAGDVAAQAWTLLLLQRGLPAAPFARALLACSATTPHPLQPESPA